MNTTNIHAVTAIDAGEISENTLPSGALYWRRTITIIHDGQTMALTLFSDNGDTSLGVDDGDAHAAEQWRLVASEEGARCDELERELADARNAHLDVLRDINLVREALGVSAGQVSGEELVDKIREREQALAAHVERIQDAFLPAKDGTDGGRLLAIGYVLNESPAISLARRDAAMKAEAFIEAGDACTHIEKGQNDLAWMNKEVALDGEEYVGEHGIPYSNKALGAQHCRYEMARLQLSYRRQAEGGA